MYKKYLMLTVLALISCSVFSQVISDSVQIEGHYRVFHFIKPTGKNASLMFILHGSGGNGRGQRKQAAKIEEAAQQENILLVYPDGYKKYWNECRKTAQSAANLENINDNAFFDYMISYMKNKYAVDQKKVFVVGTSGGGHMAYKLALTMPDKFRAVTALIASLPAENNMDCVPSGKAVPVMIVNGTADKTSPYEGGEVKSGNVSLGLVRATDSTFRYWASLAGYKGEPVKALLPDVDPGDGKTIEKYTFQSKGKPEVTLLKVLGGQHNYPNDIDVYLEAWAFFKRQMVR